MKPVKSGQSLSSVATLAGFKGISPTLHRSSRAELSVPIENGTWQREQLRRLINVVIAAIAILVLSPVMLLVALLVRISSPGPIFYRQARVGIDRRNGNALNGNWRRKVDYGGRLFQIYKFRTMYVESGDPTEQVWAKPGDPRVTPIGAVLRRYRLDELPQLFNVLRGEMNIVGPRPEQPRIFADLREQIDRYPVRQRVLPGITGWAQINQSYDFSVEDVRNKLLYDIEYIEQRSPAQDLKIMLRTVPVVVFKRGAW